MISPVETWSLCWRVGAKIVFHKPRENGERREWEVLGSGSGSEQFFGNLQKTFFIRQISETFPKSSPPNILPADSLAPNEQPNMEDLVMDCQTIRYSDYQKRLESGSGCYGFSDYRHLERLSFTHLPPHWLLGFRCNMFSSELLNFFFLSKTEPSLGNEIILKLGFDCKTIEKHHLRTLKVPSHIISFSVRCTSLDNSVLVLD